MYTLIYKSMTGGYMSVMQPTDRADVMAYCLKAESYGARIIQSDYFVFIDFTIKP